MFPTLAIAFPAIDPVAVQLGPFSIHWYALSYVGGIFLGWWYLYKLNAIEPVAIPKYKKDKEEKDPLDDIILWAILGIVVGGRTGYVLFYNFEYYLSNPLEAFQMWKGGMSFHGGLLGVIFAIYLFAKKYKARFWEVIDIVACVTPIGLFLGRIANFINGELYGRVAEGVSWSIIFPGQILPRHPSQLYEAAMEGILLLIIMLSLVHFTKAKQKPGVLSGCFLIGYAIFRSIAELFREPDAHIGFLFAGTTMGQLLSAPMILYGLYLIFRPYPRTK